MGQFLSRLTLSHLVPTLTSLRFLTLKRRSAIKNTHSEKSSIGTRTAQLASDILSVIESYRIPSSAPDAQAIQSITRDLFLPRIHDAVRDNKPLELVLPAFPFKSPNSMDKVLGTLTDKCEEVALTVLQGLCDQIKDVYPPGVRLVIVSDGIVYNDLLGVSDETVWTYGEALRKLASDLGCTSIQFSRISQLPGSHLQGLPSSLTRNLDLVKYQQLAPLAREKLVQQYGQDDFDIKEYIASDPAVKSTYLGYLKFLELDLARNTPKTPSSPESEAFKELKPESRNQFRKRMQVIAKCMIARGKCFAALIKEAYPQSIRLSIHPGNATYKIPISILPTSATTGTKCMTPWHSTMVCSVDGSLTAMHCKDVDAFRFELQFKNGMPWCYREKSPIFEWEGLQLNFDYIQPCGVIITPAKRDTALSSVDMAKIRQLAERCSPVILRGFTGSTDRELFIEKGREMGPIMPWKFGELLEVKDGGEEGRGLNNVLSTEPMPYHYDGLFKKVNGKSTPPRFQMFVAKKPGPKGTGHTLFATSRLIFKHLPESYSVERLRRLTWNVATLSFEKTVMDGNPLVITHPTQQTPALRYHEDWPKERTRFDETRVQIENTTSEEDVAIRKALDVALYDRRVALRVSWEEGDVLISDNISTMHTREGYTSDHPRELWRLHID